MSWLSNLPVLLAQADAAAKDGKSALDILLIIAVVLAIEMKSLLIGESAFASFADTARGATRVDNICFSHDGRESFALFSL